MHHQISSSTSIATSSIPSLLVLECFCISYILGEAPKPSGLGVDSFLEKDHERRHFWLKCFTNSINLNQRDPSRGTMLAFIQWKWGNFFTTYSKRENKEATTTMMKRPPKQYTPRLGEYVEISALPLLPVDVVWLEKYFRIIFVILSLSSVTFKVALEM